MEKKKILLVDCDLAQDSIFIHLLMNFYEVKAVRYINTAKLELKQEKYDLVISGVEMSSLQLYSQKETENDFLTGFVFFENEILKTNTPVLFWTWNADVMETFKMMLKQNPNYKMGFVCKQNEENHLLIMVNLFFEKVLTYLPTDDLPYKVSSHRVIF